MSKLPSATDVLACFRLGMDSVQIADHFKIRESEAVDLLHLAMGYRPHTTLRYRYPAKTEVEEKTAAKPRVTLAHVSFLEG